MLRFAILVLLVTHTQGVSYANLLWAKTFNAPSTDSTSVFTDSSSVFRVSLFRKRASDAPFDLITLFIQNKSTQSVSLKNGEIRFRTQKPTWVDSSKFETVTPGYIVLQSHQTDHPDSTKRFLHHLSLHFLDAPLHGEHLEPGKKIYIVVKTDTTESSSNIWHSIRLITPSVIWTSGKALLKIKTPPIPDPIVSTTPTYIRLSGPDLEFRFEVKWDSLHVIEPLPLGVFQISNETIQKPGVFKLPATPPFDLEFTETHLDSTINVAWGALIRWAKVIFRTPPPPLPQLPPPVIHLQKNGFFWENVLPWDNMIEITELLADSVYHFSSTDPGYNHQIARLTHPEKTVKPIFQKVQEVFLTYELIPFIPENPSTLLLDVAGLPKRKRSAIQLSNGLHIYSDSLSNGPIRWENLRPGQYEVKIEPIIYPPFTFQTFSFPQTPALYPSTPSTPIPIRFEISDSNLGRFAPFTDASLWPLPDFNALLPTTNVRRYVMGFIVNDQTGVPCMPKWGGYTSYSTTLAQQERGDGPVHLKEMLSTFRKNGGHAALSLGGANGTPIEATCPDAASLFRVLDEILTAYETNELDFDIEGKWVNDRASIEKRIQATQQLQDKRPLLKLWLTLPVLPSGLTEAGFSVVKSFVDAGVRLTGINLMTMNYGIEAAPDPDKLGDYAIQALDSTFLQLKSIFNDVEKPLSDQQLWHLLGVTPMLGINDVVREVFTTAHAETLRDFAIKKRLGLVSMWSSQRDFPCQSDPDTQVSLRCSGTIQKDFDFSQIFLVFRSDEQNIPIPATPIDRDETPERPIKMHHFPNPFNESAQIELELPTSQHIRLAVFDVLGRERRILAEGIFEKGLQRFTLKARDLASGYYFLRLETATQMVRRPMLLLR